MRDKRQTNERDVARLNVAKTFNRSFFAEEKIVAKIEMADLRFGKTIAGRICVVLARRHAGIVLDRLSWSLLENYADKV